MIQSLANFSQLKLSTKSLLAICAVFAALWSVPQTHDLISSVIGNHPRIQALAALLAAAYAVLHNPQFQAQASDGIQPKQ